MITNSYSIAIGYARISIKDQSTYSLTYQEQAIKRYCEQNNLTLIAFFRDDGESSDTFDRPNWKALEEFLQKHKDLVQYLVVVELDRFSRELIKALQKIDELYQKYKIRVVAVSEPISQDSSSPSSFLIRGIKLLLA
ncbi:recombinase family protein [Chitinophaga sp. CB10]|uniref:recombinase family protein n=1 Tax=Chitinophaga sp. CB10 TaxID=1891659 RepID=UPI0025C63FD2|nr:recombinase family protein [Chitinophaga sp. CB10]